MKNISLRIICFICFVIAPIYVIMNTPVLKQFYCAKKQGKCLVRVYNMMQQKPSFKDEFMLADIIDVKPEKCNSLFGVYKENCVAISTKDGKNHYLEFSFQTEQDTKDASDDFKKFLKEDSPDYQQYKFTADKDFNDLNTILFGWGMIILVGLLISMGVIKDTTGSDLTYKEQFEEMKNFFKPANLKTLPSKFVDWFENRVIRKWFLRK